MEGLGVTITEGQIKHYTGLADDAKRWEDLRSLVVVARDAAKYEASHAMGYRDLQLRQQGAAAAFRTALDIFDAFVYTGRTEETPAL